MNDTKLCEANDTEAVHREAIDTVAIDTEAIDTWAIDAGAIDTGAVGTKAINTVDVGIATEAIDTGAVGTRAIGTRAIDTRAIDTLAIDPVDYPTQQYKLSIEATPDEPEQTDSYDSDVGYCSFTSDEESNLSPGTVPSTHSLGDHQFYNNGEENDTKLCEANDTEAIDTGAIGTRPIGTRAIDTLAIDPVDYPTQQYKFSIQATPDEPEQTEIDLQASTMTTKKTKKLSTFGIDWGKILDVSGQYKPLYMETIPQFIPVKEREKNRFAGSGEAMKDQLKKDGNGDNIGDIQEVNPARSALRAVTWLPMSKLPFPRISINLFYARDDPPLIEMLNLIATDRQPPPQVTMKYEILRLCTFKNYPRTDKPFLLRFAKAGFYYASHEDGVVCYCCGIRKYGWGSDDDPKSVHLQFNSRCKFFSSNEEFNIPALSEGPLRENVAALDDIPESTYVDDDDECVDDEERVPAYIMEKDGVQVLPKHPEFGYVKDRLESFGADWTIVRARDLADAGFFYTGVKNAISCFFCAVVFHNMSATDDISVEHARQSKKCKHLRETKGQEFIDLVQLCMIYKHENENNPPSSVKISSSDLEKQMLSEPAFKALHDGKSPLFIKESVEKLLTSHRGERPSVSSVWAALGYDAGRADVERSSTETTISIKPASNQQSTANITTSPVRRANPPDPKKLRRENEQLMEQTLCKVCLDKNVSVVFLPCGHLVACATCAPSLTSCPICREKIRGTVTAQF